MDNISEILDSFIDLDICLHRWYEKKNILFLISWIYINLYRAKYGYHDNL